jgi:hypothetical protein
MGHLAIDDGAVGLVDRLGGPRGRGGLHPPRQDVIPSGSVDASNSTALVEVAGSLLVPDRIEVTFLGAREDTRPALHMTLEVREGSHSVGS